MNRGGSRKPRRIPRDWRYPYKSYAELDLSEQNQPPSRLSQVIATKEPDIHFLDEETVEGVSLVTDSQLVRKMQVLLGNYVGAQVFEHTFFPALWAIPLSMENIHQVQSKPHFMMPKPSGPRFLLYIDSSGQTYLENMTQYFFLVDTDRAVQFISTDGRASTDTVFDGIFTKDEIGGRLTFFVCDAVRCNGVNLTKMNVFQRIAFVKENLMKPRLNAVEHQTISIKNEVFKLDIVDSLDCNSADFLDTEFEKEFKYPLRSLVFFPKNQEYVGGTCTNVLQWTENDNCDGVFRIVIQKGSNGTDTAGLQAVGPCNREIYFASSDMTDVIRSLDLRIVECRYVNGQ